LSGYENPAKVYIGRRYVVEPTSITTQILHCFYQYIKIWRRENYKFHHPI